MNVSLVLVSMLHMSAQVVYIRIYPLVYSTIFTNGPLNLAIELMKQRNFYRTIVSGKGGLKELVLSRQWTL
jgi:hypothetical protein